MPNYDYQCQRCDDYTTHFVSYENRHDSQDCRHCGYNLAAYVISMPNCKFFAPYHDESLNCDIYGERHRKEVMAEQNVQEAGDRKHGSREFNPNANNGGILPLQGYTFDDVRRNSDKRREQGENMVIGLDRVNAHGEMRTSWHRVKDLETKKDTKSKSIGEIIREGLIKEK